MQHEFSYAFGHEALIHTGRRGPEPARVLMAAARFTRLTGCALGVAMLLMANPGVSDTGEPQADAPIMGEEAMPKFDQPLTDAQAAAFSKLALDCIVTEYPNKPMQVMVGDESALTPRQLHPVFYGCFDWHSAVHGHWLLVRLLKRHPGHPEAQRTRAALAEQFSAEALLAEAEHFDAKHNRSFERMYGWAWLLRLAVELHTFDDPDAQAWAERLAPLEQRIVALTLDYLPRLDWPVRTGVHPNTAFALGQALDYARAADNGDLEECSLRRAWLTLPLTGSIPSTTSRAARISFPRLWPKLI